MYLFMFLLFIDIFLFCKIPAAPVVSIDQTILDPMVALPLATINDAVQHFSLNLKQELATQVVLEHFIKQQAGESPPQLKFAIFREPGVGKSCVIDAISWFFKQHDASSQLVVTTFTGKAVVKVGGQTIHSTLDIFKFFEHKNKNKKRNGKRNPTADMIEALRIRWASVRYFLIDEVSSETSCAIDLQIVFV